MRSLSSLVIVAAAFFLIGINSNQVFAKRPSNPNELEQRVTDLETRVDGAEGTNTTQDGRLDTLEQNQSDLQTDFADHEGRIQSLEAIPPMAGVKVKSTDGELLGYLVELEPHIVSIKNYTGGTSQIDPHITVYVPDLKKLFRFYLRERLIGSGVEAGINLYYINTLYYTTSDCTGTPYKEFRHEDILYNVSFHIISYGERDEFTVFRSFL